MYKSEFKKKMKEFFTRLKIKNNPYITNDTCVIYRKVMYGEKYRVFYIKLFDVIPFFKFVRMGDLLFGYLFNKIRILKIKF